MEIIYKKRVIKHLLSGGFEIYSYDDGRFIKFDDIDKCKELVDNEEKKEIEKTILERLNFIDRPANIDEIVEFIFNDIEDTRDKDKSFTSEDVYIGFRRFLEKDL